MLDRNRTTNLLSLFVIHPPMADGIPRLPALPADADASRYLLRILQLSGASSLPASGHDQSRHRRRFHQSDDGPFPIVSGRDIAVAPQSQP